MTEISYCAIAALIPEPLKSNLVELSARCERDYDSWYVLSSDRFPPHLTLWIAYIPTCNIIGLRDSFKDTAGKVERFRLQLEEFEIENSGFVSVHVAINEKLRRIHAEFLDNLNKLRDGYIPPKYATRLASFPKDQQESIERFGTRFAGSLFSPHLTVAVINPDKIAEARSELPGPPHASFEVDSLTLFRQGEEGRSIEIMEQMQVRQ